MTEATEHTSRHAHMMHGVAKKEKKEERRLWAALGQESSKVEESISRLEDRSFEIIQVEDQKF